MRYQELLKAINKKQFSPVYLFTGPEYYIADMLKKNLISASVSEAAALLNTMVFSDKDTSIDDILAVCKQYPLMSPYRVVMVDETVGLLSRSDDETSKAIETYLKDPSPTTILIIHDPKPDKRKKTVKSLIQKATVVDFDRLTEIELNKWIGSRLQKAHKKTTNAMVVAFIERMMYFQNDSVTVEAVDHELNKLIDYVGEDERITLKDLEDILPPSIDENIYRMIDHIISGNMGEALLMLNHFYLEGEQPIGIFALVISQLRTILQIQMLKRAGESPQAIAAKIKRPLFVVRKLIPTADHFPGNRLSEIMEESANLDLQMKTGVVDPAKALEIFLLKLKA